MAAGALEEAIALFWQSIEREPHFKALELLGECLGRAGRLREAIVPLAAATTLNRQARAPALLAEVFGQLGAWAEARELADLALGRDPQNRLAAQVRSAAATQLGEDA